MNSQVGDRTRFEENRPSCTKMKPVVSICVPNLNTRPFLRERFETIFGQSFQDWELLVSDNYSDDGAWEFFEQLAGRIGGFRSPDSSRRTVSKWNNCLRRARGKYVYIATSDDTMSADCLEKLVAALEEHQHCDLAHCPLIIIDEAGAPVVGPNWPHGTVFAESSGELLHRPHVRRAPYDGLLHLMRGHVCLSITQLLIRRSLFDRIGLFTSKWGSVGDFNWEMKAGLVANTVHVPDTWATWRRRAGQATPMSVDTDEWEQKLEEMIMNAFVACERYLDPAVAAGLKSHWLDWTRDKKMYYTGLRKRQNVYRRRMFQLAQLFFGTIAARSEVIRRVCGRPKWGDVAPAEIRLWLESLGLGPMIVFAPSQVVE